MSQILPLIKRIAQNAREKSGDGRAEKFFVFRFGARSFAIPAVDVTEVAMPASIIDIPPKSPIIKGVVNIRGVVIPVIDLRNRVGVDEIYALTDDSRLMLFTLRAGTYVGMLADDIEYRLRDGIVEPMAVDYSGNYEKTTRKVIIGSEKFPLFMVDMWLEKTEIDILQEVVESF